MRQDKLVEEEDDVVERGALGDELIVQATVERQSSSRIHLAIEKLDESVYDGALPSDIDEGLVKKLVLNALVKPGDVGSSDVGKTRLQGGFLELRRMDTENPGPLFAEDVLCKLATGVVLNMRIHLIGAVAFFRCDTRSVPTVMRIYEECMRFQAFAQTPAPGGNSTNHVDLL